MVPSKSVADHIIFSRKYVPFMHVFDNVFQEQGLSNAK